MKQLKRRAVLEFTTNPHLWKLSKPYAKAVKKYLCLDPMILRLPWPVDLIPAVGSEFYSSWLPDELHGTVARVEYDHSNDKRGIRVEIEITGQYGIDWRVDDQFLMCLAEGGVTFFGPDVPIAKVLRDAGLPSSTVTKKTSRKKK